MIRSSEVDEDNRYAQFTCQLVLTLGMIGSSELDLSFWEPFRTVRWVTIKITYLSCTCKMVYSMTFSTNDYIPSGLRILGMIFASTSFL